MGRGGGSFFKLGVAGNSCLWTCRRPASVQDVANIDIIRMPGINKRFHNKPLTSSGLCRFFVRYLLTISFPYQQTNYQARCDGFRNMRGPRKKFRLFLQRSNLVALSNKLLTLQRHRLLAGR